MKGMVMRYQSKTTYARYMGKGKLFNRGKVYKIKVHEVEMNWFEKMIYGVSGRIKDILKVKLCRITKKGVGPCINYMVEEFFNKDWKMEPNWYSQSSNRKNRKA